MLLASLVSDTYSRSGQASRPAPLAPLPTVCIELPMFEDFRRHSPQGDRGRVSGAMLVAAVLYAGLVVLVVRSTTAEKAKLIETLTQVAFAPPPPPPPALQQDSPPAMLTPQPVQNARPKVKRKELRPPNEVPKAQPKEADGELSPSAATGPQEGFLDGVEGGTGTAAAPQGAVIAPAPPPPLPLVPAVAAATNAQPAYSASAKRKEIEGEVVVVFDVLENGAVANIQIISGPEELRDSVLQTVAAWRFRPARRGTQPVRTQLRRAIRFELTE
jgi:periplasmic protein TonB